MTSFSAFGVFDGHGGKQAATFAAKNLLASVTSFLDRAKPTEAEARLHKEGSRAGSEAGAAAPDVDTLRCWMAQDAMVERLPKVRGWGLGRLGRGVGQRL